MTINKGSIIAAASTGSINKANSGVESNHSVSICMLGWSGSSALLADVTGELASLLKDLDTELAGGGEHEGGGARPGA